LCCGIAPFTVPSVEEIPSLLPEVSFYRTKPTHKDRGIVVGFNERILENAQKYIVPSDDV